MANFNKVMLIGRLTRDPETRAFANGGMVTKIGFAVTNRKKNAQTGAWEDEPMFIDCDVFNRGENGKLADLVRDRCRKGSQIMIEGRLQLDSWQDKTTGQNRSKHMIVVDNVQLLDPRPAGDENSGGGGGGSYSGGSRAPMGGGARPNAPSGSGYSQQNDGPPDDHDDNDNGSNAGGGTNAEIPF